jgi:26S proteasome regulatory subunit N2
MEEYDESLRLALESGSKFNIEERSSYVETLISKCIDDYIAKRVHNAEARSEESKTAIDPKLEAVVNKMFKRCLNDGQFTQAIGIGMESRRLDVIKDAITSGEQFYEKLSFAHELAEKGISNKQFRLETLQLIADISKERLNLPSHYFDLAKCYISLKKSADIAEMMMNLVRADNDSILIGLQLAFDLFDNEDQQLSSQTIKQLTICKLAEEDGKKKEQIQKLIDVMSGKVTHEVYRSFLSKNNKTDPLIATEVKETIPATVSVLQEACIWGNAIMNACTTDDSFLKNNIDWVGKSSNWSNFSCTSTLGMIHKGNKAHAMTILNPYLAQAYATSHPYTAGGAFYALGLINANQYDPDTVNVFTTNLNNIGQNDVICHGICLGYGLVGMATADEGIYNELKNIMFGDSAIRGEAAALGTGLIMLGSGNAEAIQDLLTYAHETQHEKIIRAISLALAFIMYGKEEAADVLFEQMVGDKDAIIRYGAMYLIGMAYVGTGNKAAIRKLLHYGVSDVDNDVRRGAVTNLGFLLAKDPEKVGLFITL